MHGADRQIDAVIIMKEHQIRTFIWKQFRIDFAGNKANPDIFKNGSIKFVSVSHNEIYVIVLILVGLDIAIPATIYSSFYRLPFVGLLQLNYIFQTG